MLVVTVLAIIAQVDFLKGVWIGLVYLGLGSPAADPNEKK
jgi:hypothetical protein